MRRLAACQRDLRRRGEQRGAETAVARSVERGGHRRKRGRGLALPEAQQRQSRLRSSSVLAGAPVGLFGLLDLAPQAIQLADLVEGASEGALCRRACQPFAGQVRLVERVGNGLLNFLSSSL